VLELPGGEDLLGHDLSRPVVPRRVMESDDSAVYDLRDPLVEVLTDELFLVRAVDEEELDRLVEGAGDLLRKPLDRRDEVRDAGALDVVLELAVAVIRVRVDGEDPHALARARGEPDTNGRFSLPCSDPADPPRAGARAGELVEGLAFFLREPAGDVLDQLLDRREVRHARGVSCRLSSRWRRWAAAPAVAAAGWRLRRPLPSGAAKRLSGEGWPVGRMAIANLDFGFGV